MSGFKIDMNTLYHIISSIVDLEEKTSKQTKLQETQQIFQRFTTLERYPIAKLLTLYAYLSDLALDHPLIPEKDKLFAKKEESTLPGRIHTQFRVLERILNLPDEIPSTIKGDELILINAYGYRSDHCKGRIYGYRNTMTLISRQCRYYLFKGLYFDLDLKNAHPTILLSYARNHNLKVETLEEYINNREGFLLNVMQNDKLTRSEAKTAVLRCLNLVTDRSLPNNLKTLHRDILVIRDHLYKENISSKVTALGEYAMTRESFSKENLEKQKISLQAQYCATEESRSLYVLYEVCIQKGLLSREATLNRKSRCISFIPFFDGAYVSFDDLQDVSEVEQILKETNELIAPYSFDQKEMEPEWDYIKEDVLRNYETIQDFLGRLTDTQFYKLLELLDIPPFSLDTKTLEEIQNRVEESLSAQEGHTNKESTFTQRFTSDKFLFELINISARMHKHSIRKKLLSIINDGDFEMIKQQLGYGSDKNRKEDT